MATMRRLHLPIQEPCHENWNAMSVEGEARRFCGVCVKQVHDLSALTEAQAATVLAEESANGRMCVRYLADKTGNILFKPDTTSLWRHTLAAAGMALALMTGCSVKGGVGERPDTQEPYEPAKPNTEPSTEPSTELHSQSRRLNMRNSPSPTVTISSNTTG